MIDLDYKLVDDDTDTGGVDFLGETLGDFLDSINMDYDTPLPVINRALRECGIKEAEE